MIFFFFYENDNIRGLTYFDFILLQMRPNKNFFIKSIGKNIFYIILIHFLKKELMIERKHKVIIAI